MRIMDAIGALALEMPFDKITVSDVTRLANCNRTTFYYHFETIEAAKGAFMDSFFVQVPPDACLSAIERGGTLEEPAGTFDSLCTILALNQTGEIRRRVRDVAVKRARAALSSTKLDNVQIELRSVLIAEGAISMMAYRGNGGNVIELEELTKAATCFSLR
jgi:AcrR family transcriptional regulator